MADDLLLFKSVILESFHNFKIIRNFYMVQLESFSNSIQPEGFPSYLKFPKGNDDVFRK